MFDIFNDKRTGLTLINVKFITLFTNMQAYCLYF